MATLVLKHPINKLTTLSNFQFGQGGHIVAKIRFLLKTLRFHCNPNHVLNLDKVYYFPNLCFY